MELRVLRYFLALAREESITGAAVALHVTQPTLSRQLSELESEIGKQLFFRGSRKTTLTEDGIKLRKRAQEIIDLVDKTVMELSSADDDISGVVSIGGVGGGESDAMRLIARTMKSVREDHKHVRYQIYSGSAEEVIGWLDKELFDFGILTGAVDIRKYDYLRFTDADIWGLLMRTDSELADSCSVIKPETLQNLPLLYPRYALIRNELSGWLGYDLEKLNIVSTYNLIDNAGLMVEEGVGYAMCLSKLADQSALNSLCFKPLAPQISAHLHLIWKRSRVFSKAAEKFLQMIQNEQNRVKQNA